jgi:hypothetical protein
MRDFFMNPITAYAIFTGLFILAGLYLARQARIVTEETNAKTRALE